jgi:hypothetical protein
VEVITSHSQIVAAIAEFQAKTRKIWNACVEASLPAFSVGKVKEGYIAAKSRGVKISYITEITNENLTFCKELVQFAELRHLDGVAGNFALSDTEYIAGIIKNGQMISLVKTDVREIVQQQQLLFQTLWRCSQPAADRISRLE